MGKAKKTGKGVDSLFEQFDQEQREQKAQARRDKDAKAKREKRAAARANRDAAKVEEVLDRKVAIPNARAVKRSASTTTSGGAFDPDPPPKGVNQRTIKISLHGVANTPETREQFARAFAGKDEPAPVRLTLAALAKAFDDACTHTETAQAVLEDAVRQQAKAKEALDQACSRRANGERA